MNIALTPEPRRPRSTFGYRVPCSREGCDEAIVPTNDRTAARLWGVWLCASCRGIDPPPPTHQTHPNPTHL